MERKHQPYAVQFTEVALKSLRRYPRDHQRRILARIEALAADPPAVRDVKRLVDFDVS